jgi:hypothetical protein
MICGAEGRAEEALLQPAQKPMSLKFFPEFLKVKPSELL